MTIPQQPLGVQSGYATETTCKVVLCSLVNTATTFVCNGVTYTSGVDFSWVQAGTDHGTLAEAGFTATLTVTGLSGFTQYPWTATQGSSIDGNLMTTPGEWDDFCFFFGSCDNNSSLSAPGAETKGFYPYIQAYIESPGSLPCVGYLFVDDIGYNDWVLLDDTATGIHKTTGFDDTPIKHSAGDTIRNLAGWLGTYKQYDYALGYLTRYGLFSDVNSRFVAWGRDEYRNWVIRNMNFWPAWGDHEFVNELGWDKDEASTAHATWVPGKAMWDAFMKPLQPPLDGVAAPRDTGARHFSWNLGCITIAVPDNTTNANGKAFDVDPAAILYGDNQIDDVKEALNTTAPFKIVALGNSIRGLGTNPSSNKHGAQNPISDHIPAEYERFFTNNTYAAPLKSISNNPNTNGVSGQFITLHGDYHVGQAVRHHAAAFANNDAENYYSFTVGTIGNSLVFGNDENLVAGGDYPLADPKTELEYMQDLAEGINASHGIRVEVYGSRSPREMHVILMDSAGAEVWHKKFVASRGNNKAYAADAKLVKDIGISAGDDAYSV